MVPRDLDGRSSSLSFRSVEEQALWARLAEAAFSHALRTHGSLEESVRSAVDVADRLVVELRERSGSLPQHAVLVQPPSGQLPGRQPSGPDFDLDFDLSDPDLDSGAKS